MSDPTTQPVEALPEPAITFQATGNRYYTPDQMRTMMAERDAAREERDAALERAEFCLAFTRDAQDLCATAQAEASALRRELETFTVPAEKWPYAEDSFMTPAKVWTAFRLEHTRRQTLEVEVAACAKRLHNQREEIKRLARPIPPAARELLAPERVDEIWQECSDPDRADMSIQQFAEAIQRAAREGREPQWQPIETAPKDMASYMFLCSGVAMQGFRDATGELCVCQEEGTKRWRSMRRKPTHWMPLPIGPAGTSADGETQP